MAKAKKEKKADAETAKYKRMQKRMADFEEKYPNLQDVHDATMHKIALRNAKKKGRKLI